GADPPHADPAAVLHVRLVAEVAYVRAVLEGVLAPRVVDPVVGQRVLAALLVVDHQVDRHQRAAGPADPRGLGAVAHEAALGAGERASVCVTHEAIMAARPGGRPAGCGPGLICSLHGCGVRGALPAESELQGG